MKTRLAITTVVFLTLIICSLPTTVLSSDGKNLPEIVIKVPVPAPQNSAFGVLGDLIKNRFAEITGGRAKRIILE